MVRDNEANKKYYEALKKLPTPDGEHCIICGKTFKKKDRRRKYCSDECYTKWYESLGMGYWNTTRAEVLKRDKYTCQRCGWTFVPKENVESYYQYTYSSLEVHHIIPIKDGGVEFDKKNCITLCHKCHMKTHRELRIKEHGQKLLSKIDVKKNE